MKETVPADSERLVDKVRERYGRIGSRGTPGCCGGSPEEEVRVAEQIGYARQDVASVPEGANLGLGCGAPIDHLDLRPGEVLLDLGSGGGFDAFLAARHVGTEGRVIGVDMTPEMIERATRNAREAGLDHVEFRLGRLESLPVDDCSVDAVTSNCVVNLVPDKGRVFREVARVLRPGGRLVVSDIVLDGELPAVVRQDLLSYVGCVAGAMQRQHYFSAVRDAGLQQIEILRDIDVLGLVDDQLPEEALELMQRTGVSVADLAGRVRSITFRAMLGEQA